VKEKSRGTGRTRKKRDLARASKKKENNRPAGRHSTRGLSKKKLRKRQRRKGTATTIRRKKKKKKHLLGQKRENMLELGVRKGVGEGKRGIPNKNKTKLQEGKNRHKNGQKYSRDQRENLTQRNDRMSGGGVQS